MSQNKQGKEFSVTVDSKRQDSTIHEPILAQGDHKAAEKIGREVAKKIGLTDAAIAALYDPAGGMPV